MSLDKRHQIRNGFLYMLPFGLSALMPFITIPIFTRILIPADYGVLALAMIYASFSNGFVNLGMTIAFERNYFQYSKDKRKLAQLLFTSLVFVSANFILLTGITYLFKDNISVILTGTSQNGTLILIAFMAHFFSGTAINFYFIYFRNAEKANTYSKYRIIGTVSNTMLSLFLVAFLRIGVIGIVVAQLITGVVLFFFLLFLFLKELQFSLNKKIMLESIIIGYPLIPRTFIGVLNTQFDKYMIGLLATIGGVGVYHIGKKVSEMIFAFMTAIENVFNPQVYQRMFNQHEQGNESIGKYLTPFLYISIFLALCVAIFSEELITVLTPGSYHGAIPICTILSMYFGFLFFGKIVGMQLIYAKKTKITSLLTLLSVGFNVGFNIPLIMKFGVIGAALGTLLAGLISGVISLCIAQHYYKINYEWEKIIWIMGTFFIGSTIITFLNLLNTPYFWSLLVKITAMIIFINIGVRYGIFNRKNYQDVRALFYSR